MLLPKFKCHCSAIADIMSNPQKKTDKISKTAITTVQKWMDEALYDRKQGFSSKYTAKGNEVEDDSIEFAARILGWKNAKKNTVKKENDWFIGTCDVDMGKLGADLKNSWSEKTFPKYSFDSHDKGYELQLQGYSDLYGFEGMQLVYTLMDAPEFLIEQEAKKKQYELRLEELDFELFEEVKRNMTYSNLPDFLRIRVFEFERNLDMINEARNRVNEINNWLLNDTDFYEKLNRKYGYI